MDTVKHKDTINVLVYKMNKSLHPDDTHNLDLFQDGWNCQKIKLLSSVSVFGATQSTLFPLPARFDIL